MKIAVIVASRGRPEEVRNLLKHLSIQSYPPDSVILSVVDKEDIPSDATQLLSDIPCILALSEAGSCRQRNTGLELLSTDYDIVVFYDDDYIPSKFALSDVIAAFKAHSELVGLTGNVLADGVTKGGISLHKSQEIVVDYDNRRIEGSPMSSLANTDLKGLYGCNMALRVDAIKETRFDEALPLYGWLEDLDFSNRVGRTGFLAASHGFAGVHQGVTHGRTPGKRLGYSQIVNPVYLMRKGTIPIHTGLITPFKNFTANHVKSIFKTDPWIDRKGRAKGNWMALTDIIRGHINPSKILKIDQSR